MTDEPVPLHECGPIRGLLDFLRNEIDAGRVAAFTIVAVSQQGGHVQRHTWVAPNGASGYLLAGALQAELATIVDRINAGEADNPDVEPDAAG